MQVNQLQNWNFNRTMHFSLTSNCINRNHTHLSHAVYYFMFVAFS